MKKIVLHPPREKRPKMWRSLEELENTPEFEEHLYREFPRGADVWEDGGLSRRDFIKLLGASMALAGVGFTGCRRPEQHLVPFKDAVEWTIPGKNLYYATSMPTRHGALPLIATTVDGRPIKLEGNPLHVASNGSTDAFAQASVLDLYDPHRAKEIRHLGKAATREELDAYFARVREKFSGNGDGFAVLAGSNNSPTRARLQSLLQSQFTGMIWAEYEPLGDENAKTALRAAFGAQAVVVPQLENADVLLALDSDFLNPAETGIGFAKGFAQRRNPDQPMNRLYSIESTYTITGGMADHRLPVKIGSIPAITLALAKQIAEDVSDPALAQIAAAAAASGNYMQSDMDSEWIKECAADLAAHRGRAVVICGPQQPVGVQALVVAINQALAAYGDKSAPFFLAESTSTVSSPASITDLANALHAGKVKTLFILGGNPAYNAPADLDFVSALGKADEILHLSFFEDETSRLSTWQVPAAHYLEQWGDGLALDGTYTPVQPMILPLYDGLSEFDVLAALAGLAPIEGPSLIKETFATRIPQGLDKDPELLWNEFLRKGFLEGTAFPPASRAAYDPAALASLATQIPSIEPGDELVFLQSSALDDGRYANNSWLQETPDFVTKITWDNALLASPADAAKLGVKDGDMVAVRVGGTTMEAALVIAPGQAEGSFAIALGYGRKGVSALMDNVGFDAYPLRLSTSPRVRGGVRVEPLGKTYPLARTQLIANMEGRDLAREGTIADYQANPDFAKQMGESSHLTPLVRQAHQLFTNDFLTAKEQWAMAIDLNICTGCNACLVACRAENNVPVVGKDQVRRGRDMAWIRIDRWFAGEPQNPEMLPQTILCQQCENAPCETVCPVNATVHSEDGLNLMAYNRCIGTRYCANNCPWKVRRFNFFDYNQRPLDKLYWGPLAKKGMADSLRMSKNPNVTVRMRGVMEKCTFCIQRIEEAKIARLVEAGASESSKVPIGPFQTACQQVCPTDAIVFGNQNDPNSLVAKLRKSPRGYLMFEYLNTRPRVTYLARVKNPNPKMPGAALVGRINSIHTGGHGGRHSAPGHEAHGTDMEYLPTGENHGVEAHST
jgi:molybdopterin-containing oxidoreductase family iron-sulfur binding subunit